jgi:hypothetical protein
MLSESNISRRSLRRDNVKTEPSTRKGDPIIHVARQNLVPRRPQSREVDSITTHKERGVTDHKGPVKTETHLDCRDELSHVQQQTTAHTP